MSEQRDIKNNIDNDLASFHRWTANETATSAILDTANYGSGIMFGFAVRAYTDGTYTTTLYESDDSGMSGETVIASGNLIGSLSNLIFTADTSVGSAMQTIGVIGTKRYIRVKIAAVGSTIAGTSIAVITNKVPEYKPVS